MSRLTEWMDRSWYPSVDNNWDDRFFRERILEHLRPEHHVLDEAGLEIREFHLTEGRPDYVRLSTLTYLFAGCPNGW